jgi:exonuclease V gamma subunit
VFNTLSSTEAKEHLGQLLELYVAGRARPLPFFPEASLSYVQGLARHRGKPDARERALEQARRTYGTLGGKGFFECDDAYVARAFSDVDPLQDEGEKSFAGIALKVFAPMLSHQTEAGQS